MYLLTMGWILAHTSLAMTPEHSATNGEYSMWLMTPTKTRPHKPMLAEWTSEILSLSEICKSTALQEHVPHITQSVISSMTEPTHTPVARQAQMAALLNWQQMRPHAKPQNPLQLGSAHEDFPVDWADLICKTRLPPAICAQLHPQATERCRVQGHRIKGGLLSYLKSQLQLTRLHLNRSTNHQWAVPATCPAADWQDRCKHIPNNIAIDQPGGKSQVLYIIHQGMQRLGNCTEPWRAKLRLAYSAFLC